MRKPAPVNVSISSLLLSTLLLAGCATSPTGRTQFIMIDDATAGEMGQQAFTDMRQQYSESQDPGRTAMVQCIADALIAQLEGEHAELEWDVVLFADDSINAFALPGGHVGVFEGLLDVATDQHQLAAVIGHEMAHVTARHGAERVSRHQATGFAVNVLTGMGAGEQTAALLGLGAQVGVLLPFDRAQESEADRLGLEFMAHAGFEPDAAIELWRNMEAAQDESPPEFLSTHPASDTRIEDLEDQLPQAREIQESARAEGRQPECD